KGHRHTRNHRPHRHHRHRTTHRHHRSHTHGGVHVRVGWPYWYSHHRHHIYHHHPHVVHRDTQVIVVQPDDLAHEQGFVMPQMDCPIRTDEVRSANEQWCATPRGTRHGPYRRWYEDGTLAAQGEY